MLLQCINLSAVIDPAPLRYPPLRPLNVSATVEHVERFFEDDALFRGPESFVFNDDGRFEMKEGAQMHALLQRRM